MRSVAPQATSPGLNSVSMMGGAKYPAARRRTRHGARITSEERDVSAGAAPGACRLAFGCSVASRAAVPWALSRRDSRAVGERAGVGGCGAASRRRDTRGRWLGEGGQRARVARCLHGGRHGPAYCGMRYRSKSGCDLSSAYETNRNNTASLRPRSFARFIFCARAHINPA